MAKKKSFQVKPLKRYEGAHYPSFVPERPEEEKAHPVTILLCLVLVMGLSLGVIGCFSEYKWLCDDGLPPDANGDCPGDDPECLPGLVVCRGDTGASICNDDGESWNNLDCNDYCGPEATAVSCDAEAANPCQCEYDIGECEPGDVACENDYTVSFCGEDETWSHQDCYEYCQENFGWDYWSWGCDAQAEDPCQCQYDIIEGIIAECTPGEFYCGDEQTAWVCFEEGFEFEAMYCEEYCHERFGEYVSSGGCYDQADVPCKCYDIVDGDVAECTPGDLMWCTDGTTARVCGEDGWEWTYQDCSLHCLINYGHGSQSGGCNEDNGDNFCSCS
jgi:hypothetical protein